MIAYQDATVTVHAGDCLDVLATLPDASVDSVVTDPPYSLAFMGRTWDSHVSPEAFQAWCKLWAAECLRVLKPGGHLLAFGGTRTSHRLACAIEDAGFEIRDSIAWLYGSGFPKSLDVGKAIDKAAGAEREVTGIRKQTQGAQSITRRATQTREGYRPAGAEFGQLANDSFSLTAPATADARTWQGWGTALKPAHEPIVVARKPLVGTVAANVLRYGTGALNVDGCRVEHDEPAGRPSTGLHGRRGGIMGEAVERHRETTAASAAGRWPANVTLDESQADALDAMSGERPGMGRRVLQRGLTTGRSIGGDDTYDKAARQDIEAGYVDSGGASRFMYTAKASSEERVRIDGIAHSTVKPLSLMRWLVRLVTPPGGTVLEPFAGSGTTVEACILEGFRCIAVEREADYLPLIVQRVNRRRDPVAAVKATGEDGGLFELLGDEST